ncbi:MAG TPA: protein phosphatase CheZ [Halothiobacillus sp.]|nr:protein phosphatase CheZ [Halothiobacillus sp.]
MDESEKLARLAHARALLAALEADDEAAFAVELDALAMGQRQPVFEEVGRMTREVHQALMAFATDDRLSCLAEAEMPDARDRLRYVITLTDQAANRTLALVEEALPVTDRLMDRSERLRSELAQVARTQADNSKLVTVIQGITEYLDSVLNNGGVLKTQLTEVMMAQEFQDLSGQLLQRVIVLLETLEAKMLGLLQKTHPVSAEKTEADQSAALRQGLGPAIPTGKNASVKADTVKNQDDVDDLLASLGF